MPEAGPFPGRLGGALSIASIAFSLDVLSARITGASIAPELLALTAGFWAAAGALAGAASSLLVRRFGAFAGLASASVPLLIFVAAVSFLSIARDAALAACLLAALGSAALLALTLWAARYSHRERTRLVTWGAIGVMAVSAPIVWLARSGEVDGGLGATLLLAFALVGAAFTYRWTPAWALGAALAALVPGPVFQPNLDLPDATRSPRGRDILLVVVDTLRLDAAREMASYRRLADEGVALERVQAAAPWTLPSMASVHTGTAVSRHGARIDSDGRRRGISTGVSTLAERLHDGGWITAAVVGPNPNVAPGLGFARGFDHFDFDGSRSRRFALPSGSIRVSAPVPVVLARNLANRFHVVPLLRFTGAAAEDDSGTQVDAAIEVMRRRGRNKPLFLWVHLIDPHVPYRHAVDASAGLSDADAAWLVAHRPTMAQRAPGGLDPDQQSSIARAYRHEVDVVDRNLARLLDASRALLNDPIIVFTSDHGEELFDHGGYEHGHTLYQELLSVPMIVSGTGTEPIESAIVAGHIDIAPTLLSLAGLAAPGGMDGRDLVAATGPDQARESENLLWGNGRGGGVAIRDGDWKVMMAPGLGTMLVDLGNDPVERRNRYEEMPARATELLNLRSREHAEGSPVAVDPVVREQLEALGYTE